MEYSSSENLDDGELWLPSDIFPVEETVSSTTNNNKLSYSLCCCYSCVLLLRHHHHNNHSSIFMAEQEESAAISLLQYRSHNTHTHSIPKPFPITERRFRPAERCCSCTDCSISEYFERNRRGRELLLTGPPPVQFQHQVESLMEARALILQKEEQNRFIRMQRRNLGLDRFTGNRVSPFVGGGGSGGGGGGGGGFNGESSSVRDYGGTGVFLPRIPTNINNNGRKRQGGRNRQDVQQTNQRYPCI